MKLIAIKWITDQLPAGAAFEIPDHEEKDARALIEAGLAREDKPDIEQASRRTYRRRDLTAEP